MVVMITKLLFLLIIQALRTSETPEHVFSTTLFVDCKVEDSHQRGEQQSIFLSIGVPALRKEPITKCYSSFCDSSGSKLD